MNKPNFEGNMNRIQKSLDIDISVTIKKIGSLSEEELKPRSEGHILVESINKKLNVDSIGSVLFCDTFFAHVHDDTEAVEDTGQIMVVIENNENHILYSSDFEGNDFTIVPKAGDIIFLNIWSPHAVLPNQSNGINAMRQNSMKLVCFN